MSFATCFQGVRGLPFFESGATVVGSQVIADSNGAGGLAGQCHRLRRSHQKDLTQ